MCFQFAGGIGCGMYLTGVFSCRRAGSQQLVPTESCGACNLAVVARHQAEFQCVCLLHAGGTGCGLCLTATSAVGKWWPTEPWHPIWTTCSMTQASLAVRYVMSCGEVGGLKCPGGRGGSHVKGGKPGHMIHKLQHCTKPPTTATGPLPLLTTAVNHQQMLRFSSTGFVLVFVTGDDPLGSG